MKSEPLQNNGGDASRQRTHAEIRLRAQKLLDEQNARLGFDAAARKKRSKLEGGAPIGAYVFGFLVSGFVAVTGISGYAELKTATDMAQKATDAQIQSESARSVALLAQWIEANMAPARAAVNSTDLLGMDQSRGQRYLVDIGKQQRQIQALALISHNGQQIARSDGKPTLDNADRLFYKKGIMGQEVYDFEVSKTSGRPALFTGVPIVSEDKVVGVLMSNSDLSSATDTIFPKFGRTGASVLVDADSKVLFAEDKKLIGKKLPYLGSAVAHDMKIPRAVSMSRKELDDRFAIISMIDEEEAYEPVARVKDAVLYNFGIGLAGSLAIALMLGFIASRSMRAIASLIEDASRAGSVEKLVEIERELDKTANASEVRMLVRSIKRLISSIKISILTRKA